MAASGHLSDEQFMNHGLQPGRTDIGYPAGSLTGNVPVSRLKVGDKMVGMDGATVTGVEHLGMSHSGAAARTRLTTSHPKHGDSTSTWPTHLRDMTIIRPAAAKKARKG